MLMTLGARLDGRAHREGSPAVGKARAMRVHRDERLRRGARPAHRGPGRALAYPTRGASSRSAGLVVEQREQRLSVLLRNVAGVVRVEVLPGGPGRGRA